MFGRIVPILGCIWTVILRYTTWYVKDCIEVLNRFWLGKCGHGHPTIASDFGPLLCPSSKAFVSFEDGWRMAGLPDSMKNLGAWFLVYSVFRKEFGIDKIDFSKQPERICTRIRPFNVEEGQELPCACEYKYCSCGFRISLCKVEDHKVVCPKKPHSAMTTRRSSIEPLCCTACKLYVYDVNDHAIVCRGKLKVSLVYNCIYCGKSFAQWDRHGECCNEGGGLAWRRCMSCGKEVANVAQHECFGPSRVLVMLDVDLSKCKKPISSFWEEKKNCLMRFS